MVAVGDEGPAGGEVRGGLRVLVGVGDRPQPVTGAVGHDCLGERVRVGGVAFDQVGGRAATLVGEQDRLGVRAYGVHERLAVRDDRVHDVLVWQNGTGIVPRQFESADQAALEAGGAVLLPIGRAHG